MNALVEQSRAAYGAWVATFAPPPGWSFFVTLTHDPRRLSVVGHDRIGRQLHRSRLRSWFYDDVRALDPSALWWSETELHISGQPHEHGLLWCGAGAPDLRMRQAWYEAAGYAKWERIVDAASVAAYVAKYAGKATSGPPNVWGMGAHAEPSHSLMLPR